MRHRMVKGISGFGGNNQIDPHFGLGTDARVVDIAIRWPSGRLQTLENPGIDRVIEVREPETGPRGSVAELIDAAAANSGG